MAGGLAGVTLTPQRMFGQPVTPEKEDAQISPHLVTHGPGFGNRIALTFDDGPTPGVTELVLKQLADHKLHATFFMIGANVKAYPALAKEVADAGHEIGNHSWDHPMLISMSEEKVDSQIQRTQDIIHEATGKTPVWFRPPYGAFSKDRQGHIPATKGLGIALWSVDPRDWSQPGSSAITSRVVTSTGPGSIVLLHDLHPQTAAAVPDMLNQLEEKDFNMVHLSGFLGAPYGSYFASTPAPKKA